MMMMMRNGKHQVAMVMRNQQKSHWRSLDEKLLKTGLSMLQNPDEQEDEQRRAAQ
jgi:hypothetical protein